MPREYINAFNRDSILKPWHYAMLKSTLMLKFWGWVMNRIYKSRTFPIDSEGIRVSNQ